MRSGEIARVDVDALTALISGALNEAALTIAEATAPKRVRHAVIAALRRLLHGLAGAPRPRFSSDRYIRWAAHQREQL